ncbi:MAG: hypothetical protein P4N59_05900 [Negativicutes bacterium]|nr:hypothetical protein [Negativicutes bacterium]
MSIKYPEESGAVDYTIAVLHGRREHIDPYFLAQKDPSNKGRGHTGNLSISTFFRMVPAFLKIKEAKGKVNLIGEVLGDEQC